MLVRLVATAYLSVSLLAAPSSEKPCITYIAPASSGDDRPVAVAITVGPQGSDYAFKIDFNKAPWGDECKARCANATIFLDTDNKTATGLQLADRKAPQTGADLAITIQGTRDYKENSADSNLRVKVKQYPEDATRIDQGRLLTEMDQRNDEERVQAQGETVYVLVDANIGDLPAGQKVRVIYQPPDSKPLVGMAKGLSAPGANRVEIFKEGRLTNPVKKKKAE
jgi:hypothetical protein